MNADPDPTTQNNADPCGSGYGSGTLVFGPPGSGSFNHQAKIVRKTLIPTVLWLLYDVLSLKNDVDVPYGNRHKNIPNIIS